MRNRFQAFGVVFAVLMVAMLVRSQLLPAPSSFAADTAAAAPEKGYCEDWKDPDVVLFITGRQHGYIEPCGCTGLANQKGGLARRQTLYRDFISKGWNVVPIDVGNQIRRFGAQPAIKFQATVNSLKSMNYQAVALGPDDLRLGIGDLIAEIANDTPMVCSNVSIAGFEVSEGHKIIRSGGHIIGVAAVIGVAEQKGIRDGEIEFSDPAQAILAAHAKFVKANCDIMVLLAHASTDESIRLATSSKAARDFRIVVTAGGADEPALNPERIPGTRSYLVQTGKKGMYVGALGIFNDEKLPMRYERIPLDARFADSQEMLDSLKNYQENLRDTYQREGWQGLGLRPVQHPSGHNFVGSQACQECHETAYDVWADSPHFNATKSIAFPNERVDIPRNFDPECLSCHVTGWDPQNFFPFASGYVDFAKSKHLHGNGCENCHGPGSGHVAAENGDGSFTDAQVEALRQGMVLKLVNAQDKCLQCHDLDNDPHFQEEGAFEEYWEQIKHYE